MPLSPAAWFVIGEPTTEKPARSLSRAIICNFPPAFVSIPAKNEYVPICLNVAQLVVPPPVIAERIVPAVSVVEERVIIQTLSVAENTYATAIFVDEMGLINTKPWSDAPELSS